MEASYQAFEKKKAQIDDAIRVFSYEVDRLNEMPIANHESSLEQRLKTLEVYESRVTYLKALKDQLDQLHK